MERYSRNIILEKIGLEGQKKLLDSKVLVAGVGGLGSYVLVNLAGLGIGNIGILDYDVIELSNLNRQFLYNPSQTGKLKTEAAKKRILKFNPDINIETFNTKLNESNYQSIIEKYDIIVDCFDSFESKFLLNDIAVKTSKTLVHGAVSEFKGQVMTVIPGSSACLRCIIPYADLNEYITKGVVSPIVSVIASIEALEVMKLIMGFDGLLTNQLLIFDALKTEFKKLTAERNTNCMVCSGEN